MKKVLIPVFILVVFLMMFGCKKNSSTGPAATTTSVPATTATSISTNIATITSTVTHTVFTATVTQTSTVDASNISGTLTLPYAQPGKNYIIVVDNDLNFTNGDVKEIIGACGSGTTINYSATVATGIYYVYAFVDVDGSGLLSGWDSGDYVGYYGSIFPNTPGSANVIVPGTGVNINLMQFIATSTVTVTTTAMATLTATATATLTISLTPAYRPQGWIDDMEDSDNVCDYNGANPARNVGGYWITYDDNGVAYNGTSYVWPMAQTWATRKQIGNAGDTPPYKIPSFSMSAPGFPASPYGGLHAARVTGYVTTNASAPPGEMTGGFKYGFIGMGTQLIADAGEPYCHEVDISAYQGVKFWVKGDAVVGGWTVSLPFVTSTNGNCDGTVTTTPSSLTGSDEYKLNFTAPATWSQATFAFSTFTQEGWGTAISIADGRYWQGCSASVAGTTPGWLGTCPMSVVKQHVKAIHFQTVGQAVIYPQTRAIYVDDIQLY